ncbi:MAG: 3-methylornithyl-N6-L-lysine dehydrogenase PylD [Candidatus Aminicenantes bacterium]|nr:MAG: 3-methylornithyl-N6-L-lysine dehydrogenase PylD [Candidatus Aminicenantes bacterium]
MTRLKTEDIKDIASQLDQYDMELFQKTGCTLRGIACHAFGIPEETFQSIAGSVEVGVITFQSGQGIIEGFSKTIKQIIKHIGFRAFITKNTDVSGIAEAVERNAEVLMMADDRRFVALNVKSYRMSDNATATAKGFVAGLDLMAGGLESQKVLVIGCGPVGKGAAMAVLQREADVSVFDINSQQSNKLAREIYKAMKKRIKIETDLNMALQRYHLLVDATNAPEIIDAKYIRPYTHVAAPGIPLGLTPEAVEKISPRLLHDPLQIGVAVMAVEAVLSRSVEEWRVMLPYGSYIAQVANPHPKASQKPEPEKTPQDQDPMGATKVSAPEPEPEEPKYEPPPPVDETDEEDAHEKTEIL